MRISCRAGVAAVASLAILLSSCGGGSGTTTVILTIFCMVALRRPERWSRRPASQPHSRSLDRPIAAAQPK